MLTLVSHALCPYVQRAAIALAEHGVPFDRTVIDLDSKPAWFVELSPLGRVPLLRVACPAGETVLFESAAICEWIEDTQPGPALHPSDPTERARHRAWMEFGSITLADIYGLETTQDPAFFAAKRAALAAKFARLEATLADGPWFAGPWFAGPRFSLVDAVFGPVFRYFDTFDTILDLGLFTVMPKLRAWRAALATRPSVQGAVGPDYDALLRRFLARHDAYLLRAGEAKPGLA